MTGPRGLFNESENKFEYTKKYVFGSYVEKCNFPPVNVFKDNTDFFESLVSNREYEPIPVLNFNEEIDGKIAQKLTLRELLEQATEE